MKASGADCYTDYTGDVSLSPLLKHWYESEAEVILTQWCVAVTQDFIDDHLDIIEGQVVSTRFWPGPWTPKTMPMLEAYEEEYGMKPFVMAIQGYDSQSLMFEAIRIAGEKTELKFPSDQATRDAIRDGIAAIKDYPCVWGYREFQTLEKGQGSPTTFAFAQVQDGELQLVWPINVRDSLGNKFQKHGPPWPWEPDFKEKSILIK